MTNMMRVVKVLNNSLVLSTDIDNNEVIVMGKGLGFNSKIGDLIEKDKIEKIFAVKTDMPTPEYLRLLESIPVEFIEITKTIIQYADEQLNGHLNKQLFFTLMDHIAFAVERHGKGIIIQNRLLHEVKRFYPLEFSISRYAVQHINQQLNIELPEEEIGNIAFHLVNAQTDAQQMASTLLSVKMLKDIFNIIQYHFAITLDKDSLNYSRFLIHLQFFIQRIIDGVQVESNDHFIFEQIHKEYPEEFKCAKLIGDYIHNLRDVQISNDEMLFLIIHLVRVVR